MFMKPIRILHMIGSMNIGGSQTLLLNLYRAMDREKIQFDFVLDHPDERALADSFAALGARIYTMPSFYFTNTCQVRSAWNRFFTEHPEYKVLHCHVRSYVSLFLPIAKRHGVKVVLHSHSTSNGTGPKAILKALLQYPLRYQADAFLSCSEEAGRWLFGRKVANSAQHQVLKNAICAEQYRYDPALRQQYRSQLSLNGKTVYAHIGRFTPQKNHAFLLRVFQKIYQANQNAFLLLVGDGENRKQIHSQIQKLGLQDKVLLLGNRQDVAGILQAADVFLFPSHWEGLGTAVVEAQAAGLKCICSEGVPSIAKVVPNCRFLPLREELWIKAALDVPESRTDVYETVVAAGYDAKATALWLQKYYMELVSKRRYLFASATDFEAAGLPVRTEDFWS